MLIVYEYQGFKTSNLIFRPNFEPKPSNIPGSLSRRSRPKKVSKITKKLIICIDPGGDLDHGLS